MWWLLNQKKPDDREIMVNLDEFKKFIYKEALMVEKIEKILDQAFSLEAIMSGKSFFLYQQAMQIYFTNLIDTIKYFQPKNFMQ